MKFSALCSPDASRRGPRAEEECLALLEAADEQGYDTAWIDGSGESASEINASINVVAAGLSTRTERIRIGTTFAVGQSLHPLRLAEELAMLDVMSGGRLDWAIGPRLTEPLEPTARQLRVLGEHVEVAIRALSGEPFSFEGEFYEVPELQCFPAAVQSPYPPMLIRADSQAVLEWAAERNQAAMIGGFRTTRSVEVERLARPEREPVDAITDVYRRESLVVRYVHVAATSELARAEAGPAIVAAHRPTSGADAEQTERFLLEQCAIVGDAQHCRAQLAELDERTGLAGLVTCHKFGDLPLEAALSSQRAWIEDVAPAFA